MVVSGGGLSLSRRRRMKEYQCPVCNYVGEFTGNRLCDRCGQVVIRKPVTEGERIDAIAKRIVYEALTRRTI